MYPEARNMFNLTLYSFKSKSQKQPPSSKIKLIYKGREMFTLGYTGHIHPKGRESCGQ